jgi:glycosyltransferase involved in cell wall biosynthesis
MNGRPIRVLFVVPDLRFGGAEQHVATLLPRMDPQKFTASVICIGQEGDLFGQISAAGIEATALHLGGKRDALRALRALVAHMRGTRPDVVMVWGYNAEMLGRIAALMAGVKHSIVWVHAAIGADSPYSIRGLATRALIRWTSAYFGVAEAQRAFITHGLHCPADKVQIIHNGIDPSLFGVENDRNPLREFGIDESDPVVGIVAALRPEKDHPTLLRAVARLIADVPRAKILIVGDGPCRSEIEVLCAELGIEQNVFFAGSRHDVARLLRAIDVFVLCSTTECFPLSVLEAMACARPVVCTDVGGICEMVSDGVTGYLVPPMDPPRLAVRITEILSDPELARRLGQAGRMRVKSAFTLEQSVLATERALEGLVRHV